MPWRVCVYLVATFTLITAFSTKTINDTPTQIHLALGEAASSMSVSWSTVNATASTLVQYGTAPGQHSTTRRGRSKVFVDGGPEKLTQYFHQVTLDKLRPDTAYYYVVGSEGGTWSPELQFKTLPSGEGWSPNLAVYGDMGLTNAASLPHLVKDVTQNMYHAILHVGDFAYDFDSGNGKVGDAFMELIQPLASQVPYMTAVGNHENAYNFSHYRGRFNMPNDNGRMYYSFNMGRAHFVSISTEFYYYPSDGLNQIFDQYKWLQKDLTEANEPGNRAKRPWIVVFGHRPMYCSDQDKDDCKTPQNLVRVGIPKIGIPGLEDTLYHFDVDLAIWAHEHSYERLWPIYNYEVKNGSYKFPYTNPKGVTHITTGSAGCRERHTYFMKNPPAWSAVHSSDYGYSRLRVVNQTHLHMEQVSVDQNGKVIDSFTLIKDHQRVPYRY